MTSEDGFHITVGTDIDRHEDLAVFIEYKGWGVVDVTVSALTRGWSMHLVDSEELTKEDLPYAAFVGRLEQAKLELALRGITGRTHAETSLLELAERGSNSVGIVLGGRGIASVQIDERSSMTVRLIEGSFGELDLGMFIGALKEASARCSASSLR